MEDDDTKKRKSENDIFTFNKHGKHHVNDQR